VTFALRPGGAPSLRYAELARHFEPSQRRVAPGDPTLADVRAAVVELRRSKSMVIEPTDENRRSAGSFFMNPIVDVAIAEEVERRWARTSPSGGAVPRWPARDRVKLSAGWLIERSGFEKGRSSGRVGVSTRHALALVNRGEATREDLRGLADAIKRSVRETFDVELVQEPEDVE
jgi:UDP-N-acetylmuramate dehydrogenase